MSEKPTRRQIVASLVNGDRDPVEDADEVGGDFETLSFTHLGSNGSIVLVYGYEWASESTEAGQVIDFDILEVDLDE